MFCDIELRESINIYQKKDSMCHFGPDKDSAYIYIYIYIYIRLALIYYIIFCFSNFSTPIYSILSFL